MNENLLKTQQTMLQQGYKDEDKVMKLTENVFKCKTLRATKEEDMFQHVDFWVLANNKKYGVDVKGLHKNKRSDKNFNDSIQWIEIQNVQGRKGWIYGDAVYIAFVTNNSVIYVPTKKLIAFSEEKVKNKSLNNTMPRECYIPYQRQGRKDIIFKALTDDLRMIANHEILLEKSTKGS